MRITDEMLYKAASEAADRWLAVLPGREDCGHDFSLTFQAAMEPLLKRRRRRWRTLALLAAVIAALAGVLAFSAGAERPDRYGVYAAQEENGLASYRIRPKDSGTNQPIHQLTPEWVPEGFVLTLLGVYDDHAIMQYSFQDDMSASYLDLSQWHGTEKSSTLMGNFQLERVQVNGEEAFLLYTQEDPMQYLLWTQGADAFILQAKNVEREDMLRFADSLTW